jgi:hypothetical protein
VGETADAVLLLVTSAEGIVLATAVVAALAAAISACIAAWQGHLMKRSERNRTQPIVVAYECALPRRDGNDLVFAIRLANEGAGPALNIRFGVAFAGVTCPYEPLPAGPEGAGDVPRALGPGGQLPVRRDAYALVARTQAVVEDAALERRVYWCLYENAFGDGWETRNAWQANEELHIGRAPS